MHPALNQQLVQAARLHQQSSNHNHSMFLTPQPPRRRLRRLLAHGRTDAPQTM